jgi:hypothetical protein
MLNAISFNAPSALNSLLQPLVAIVLLYVMLKLPVHLARVAMLGAAPLGGGFVSRAVSYAAGSQVRDATRQHLPSWAGGQRDSQQQQPESRTGTRLRTAATLAGAAAGGGAAAAGAAMGAGGVGAASGAAAAGRAGAANGRAYAPPPSAQANAAGAAQSGLQTPSFAGREQDFANEKFEAEFRERTGPVSGEQARAALTSLSGDTQRGVGQLVSDHGGGAREHLAYQAMGEWSSEEREALRTLAAASPGVRAQAVSDAFGEVANGVDMTAAGSPPGGDTEGLGAGGGGSESAPHEPWADGDPGGSPARSAGDGPTQSVPSAPGFSSPAPSGARPPGPASGEAPTRRSLPPAPVRRSLPPPREPRGPSPDELFPNG